MFSPRDDPVIGRPSAVPRNLLAHAATLLFARYLWLTGRITDWPRRDR